MDVKYLTKSTDSEPAKFRNLFKVALSRKLIQIRNTSSGHKGNINGEGNVTGRDKCSFICDRKCIPVTGRGGP
jgi:hypothetical protein